MLEQVLDDLVGDGVISGEAASGLLGLQMALAALIVPAICSAVLAIARWLRALDER